MALIKNHNKQKVDDSPLFSNLDDAVDFFYSTSELDKKISTKIASVISISHDFLDYIKYYIVKFLIGDDRDLRIFAIDGAVKMIKG